MNQKTRKIVMIAMLSAVSVILLMTPFLRTPLIPAVPFLEYDAMDVPILIGGFFYGPVAGLCITLISALIQGLTVSSASGPYGIIMHIIATGAFVTTASFIYRKKSDTVGALIGLICGTLAMTLIMIPANLIITPLFLGMPTSAIKELLIPGIIPFNFLKATINSAVTFLLYVPVKKVIKRPVSV